MLNGSKDIIYSLEAALMKINQKIINVTWFNSSISKKFAYKRVQIIDKICNNKILKKNRSPIRVIEIGCGSGKDFINFLSNRNDVELIGIDRRDLKIKQDNFQMIIGDAENICFPDKYFDYAISIGVLEHIVPIEKLCSVIKEIERVSKSYVIIVPAITTLLEPHTGSFKWQLRDRNKKVIYRGNLNYFNDEVWLQFSGFKNAKTIRYQYIPLFMESLIIYYNVTSELSH